MLPVILLVLLVTLGMIYNEYCAGFDSPYNAYSGSSSKLGINAVGMVVVDVLAVVVVDVLAAGSVVGVIEVVADGACDFCMNSIATSTRAITMTTANVIIAAL